MAKDNGLVKMRLTLDVSYQPNGVSAEALADLLRAIADSAAGDGLMTGETEAEVDTWECKVQELV
jgi:hypothetical protein